jgi:hypothetical protein
MGRANTRAQGRGGNARRGTGRRAAAQTPAQRGAATRARNRLNRALNVPSSLFR